jgi:hypothetical protein
MKQYKDEIWKLQGGCFLFRVTGLSIGRGSSWKGISAGIPQAT